MQGPDGPRPPAAPSPPTAPAQGASPGLLPTRTGRVLRAATAPRGPTFGAVLGLARARRAAGAPVEVRGRAAGPQAHGDGAPLGPPEARPRARADDRDRPEPGPDEELGRFDPLDPAARRAAQLAPPVAPPPAAPAPAPPAEPPPLARGSIEELLPKLVRRIAWAGDRQRGSVRIELGAGAYAGTTLLVHADCGRVRVEVGGTGAEAEQLRQRLEARLRERGLDLEAVT